MRTTRAQSRFDLATLRSAAEPTLPLLGSIIVSFMTVGATARGAGFGLFDAVATTALVFAAPAQLVMIAMLKAGAGLLLVGLAVLIINLRLLFMSFCVVSYMHEVPTRRLAIWCSMLSGLSFSGFKLRRQTDIETIDPGREEFELAVSCILLYGAAVVSTAIGNLLGSFATPVWVDGLDVMVAMLLVGRIFDAKGDAAFITAALICATMTPIAAGLNSSFGPLLMVLALSGLFAVLPRLAAVGLRLRQAREQ